MFGLALSVASTVVLLRALEDNRLLDTSRGKIAIGWLVVEDLVMILALVLLPVLAESIADGSGKGLDVAVLAKSLGWTLGKLAVFVVLMLVVGRRAIPWLLERVAGTGSRELFTLSILAIALGVAFGSAKMFGVSFALGAFFAGMLLNESELSHKAAADSLPLRDAFAVLFFVSVGMLFDPRILVEQPLPVLATFLTITVGKSVASFLIVRAFGHPNSTALTISASLAQIGEFSFILAGLGVGLKLLPPEGRDLVLAGAILSIIANPLLFVVLGRWQQARADVTAAAGLRQRLVRAAGTHRRPHHRRRLRPGRPPTRPDPEGTRRAPGGDRQRSRTGRTGAPGRHRRAAWQRRRRGAALMTCCRRRRRMPWSRSRRPSRPARSSPACARRIRR